MTASGDGPSIGAILGAYIGHGPRRMTTDTAAHLTGASVKTVRAWLREECEPTCASLVALLGELPTAFGTSVLDRYGRRVVETECRQTNAHAVLADIAGMASLIATCLADGRLDHTERAEILGSLPALIETLDGMRRDLEAQRP